MSHIHSGESSDLIRILTKEQKQINKILPLIYDHISTKDARIFSSLSKEDFISKFTIKV